MLWNIQVSTLVGLSERTVYRRFYEGKLKSFKMGGLRVFALSDVSKFVQAEREAGNLKGNNNIWKER
ncbi:MAG: helix-turn-helix domain-containing protein, partial [Bacteroidales bacterium]